MARQLRNGTYLREPDGATLLYYSPYRFNDAASNFRNRRREDEWKIVQNAPEAHDLWVTANLQPGEYVVISGGEIVS